jgi:hypothetical protein
MTNINVPTVNMAVLMVELEISRVHVMKAYRGSRSIAPLILNLVIRWK